jgi:hypothetical protein
MYKFYKIKYSNKSQATYYNFFAYGSKIKVLLGPGEKKFKVVGLKPIFTSQKKL